MDIEHFRYFLDLASGLTFLEVAENHNFSQSALSKSITKLEDELGIKLFNRERRKATLTPAGMRLYHHLIALEPLYKDMLLDIRYRPVESTVIVYVEPSHAAINLHRCINQFHTEYPNIKVITKSPSLTNYIATYSNPYINRNYDFIITHRSMCPKENRIITPFLDDFYEVLTPVSYGFPDSISYTDLQGKDFISTENGQWCDYVRQRVFDYWKIIPASLIQESRFRDTILYHLESYGGMALFYSSDLRIFKLDGIKRSRVHDIPADPYVTVIAKNCHLSDDARIFKSYIEKNYQKGLFY